MSVHRRKKDGYWLVNWRDEKGKQHTKGFGKELVGRQKAKVFDAQQKKVVDVCKTPKELLSHYQTYLRLKDRTEKYVQSFDRALRIAGIENVPIGKLSISYFKNFQSMHSTTRNRYMSYLKGLFKFGVDNELIVNNPLKRWKKSKELPRQSQLSLEDLVKSVPHLQWAIEVAYHLGVRVGESELNNLTWNNVLWGESAVRIYGRKTRIYRIVLISESFRKKLAQQKEEAKSAYLVEYQGKPLKRYHKSWRTACKKAGLPYAPLFYEVRHLFATTLLNKGADLACVSKLLGHSSVKMTVDVYYHFLKAESTQALNLLPRFIEQT